MQGSSWRGSRARWAQVKRCSPLRNDMVLVSMDTVAANKALIVRVVVALAVVGAA